MNKVANFYRKNPDLWIQGRDHAVDGKCCIRGAAEVLYGDIAVAYTTLQDLLYEHSCQTTVESFNDDPNTTVWDVILLCYAAKL